MVRRGHRASTGNLPDPGGRNIAWGDELRPVAAEARAFDEATMADQRALEVVRSRIPDLDGSVASARDEHTTVGAECTAFGAARMAGQRGDGLSGREIP